GFNRLNKKSRAMSIRAKTKKRLLILVLIVTVLSGATVGAYLYRVNQIRQNTLDARVEGQAALEEGDYYTAMHRLGVYVNHNPKDAQALYQYAQARQQVPEPQAKHILDAVSLYRRVLDLDPTHQEARLKLLDLYTSIGYGNEAVDTADAYL